MNEFPLYAGHFRYYVMSLCILFHLYHSLSPSYFFLNQTTLLLGWNMKARCSLCSTSYWAPQTHSAHCWVTMTLSWQGNWNTTFLLNGEWSICSPFWSCWLPRAGKSECHCLLLWGWGWSDRPEDQLLAWLYWNHQAILVERSCIGVCPEYSRNWQKGLWFS